MPPGTWIALGIPIGAALWLVTDNILFLVFGLAGGLILDSFSSRDSDGAGGWEDEETKEPEDEQPGDAP